MSSDQATQVSQPTIAQLQEKLDTNLKAALETACGRPFIEGTVDDFRLDLERRGFKLVDTSRTRHLVDDRVYSRSCYELGFYRMATEYLASVCKANGFDFEILKVTPPKPEQPAREESQ